MPTITNKVYGKMVWEQWDEESGAWYARIDSEEEYETFDLHVKANSPLDFPAVGKTYEAYNSLLSNLPNIQQQAGKHLVRNSTLFPRKKERNHVANVFGRNLELFSIVIFEDLSSEITFDATILTEHDSTLTVLVDSDGKFIDAFFEDD